MKIAVIVMLSLFAIGCGIISFLQFRQKGLLFNNAYLHASKEERETMDKSPHYRQSAVVFLLLAIMWLCMLLEVCFEMMLFAYVSWGVIAVTLVYAVVSSISISKK